ncbi:hydroxyacylglutathione hydrolase [Rhodovulum sp. DZ06]|uniref:hydroxyacylglutathione hydrolase n=1 Tax=Rhodovulum sp. DZ06 TaxID=3425126 RepID=UPI003D33CD1A
MALEIQIIPCRSDNYGYLLHETEADVWAVVDAPEAGPLIDSIEAAGGRLDLVLLTHHHGDHVEAVGPLVDRYGAKVIGAAADARRLPKLDQPVVGGDVVKVGAQDAEVIEVYGHTVGHIAFHFPGAKAAFTADSLMALGCGRLFEGTAAQMWDSLSRLAALPGDTLIYSGHDYFDANARFALSVDGDNAALKDRIARKESGEAVMPVALSEELATNPFLRASAPEVKAAVGLPEADDAAVFAEVRRRKDDF